MGGWTLASRLLGFARDIAIAATLGASPVAEAFLVAFSLPNMFRRFFAEGAFNMAFVPLFAKRLEGERLAAGGAGGAADPTKAASGMAPAGRGSTMGAPAPAPDRPDPARAHGHGHRAVGHPPVGAEATEPPVREEAADPADGEAGGAPDGADPARPRGVVPTPAPEAADPVRAAAAASAGGALATEAAASIDAASAEGATAGLTPPGPTARPATDGTPPDGTAPAVALGAGSPGDALTFARDAFTGLATVLIAFTAAATIFMPALVLAMASGFAEDERFDLAVLYGRIAFPYILLISLAALLSGVLNATGRFAAAAAAPLLLNLLFLAAIGLAVALGWPVGLALAWTVPVAGAAQLALVWRAAARAGYRLVPRRPRLTPELRRLAIIAAPAMLAGGVVQVNLLVGRQVASHFEGAIAWLSYADRLYQLPLGVVGIAMGVVLLPDLSRRLQARDASGSRAALSRAGEVALALTVPASVALVAIPLPIVAVLFQRGAFGADDAAATALAVAVYGAGLPAFVMQKVLQPLYFARHDTRRPFRYALAALVINAGVAVGLAPVLGYIAAALGTTLAAWGMLWLLWRGARGMGEAAHLDARFVDRLWRILSASAVMGAALWLAGRAMAPLLAGPAAAMALAGLIVFGAGVYGLAGRALGAFRVSELRSALRR